MTGVGLRGAAIGFRRRLLCDRGMATIEMAMALPVLILFVLVGVSAIGVARTEVVAIDAAREIARTTARSDSSVPPVSSSVLPPGAQVIVESAVDTVRVKVSIGVRPLGGWLPAMTVTASATAYVEPRAGGPP
jgi:hypothetical protein